MNEDLPKPAVSVPCVAQRGGVSFATTRVVPDEQAVAFTYNGSTHAVMMATPADLEDFAVGFALTEGLIEGRDEIESLDVVRPAARHRDPRLAQGTARQGLRATPP